jgi:ribosomal-protein-alanine N-acetyltransferase
MNCHIRWGIRRDMPEVLAIESQCFEFPWDEDAFIRVLRQRNCISMVAEHDEKIAGFFAVHPAYQRNGVGRQMVEKLTGKLTADRRSRILLEIRETNLDAQLFFKAMGFRAVSVIRGFYPDDAPDEDAYLFQYRFMGSDLQAIQWESQD